MRILFSWLGRDETRESAKPSERPLTQALPTLLGEFDRIVVLSNLPDVDTQRWHRALTDFARVRLADAPLDNPVDYEAIHRQAIRCVEEELERHKRGCEMAFFLNSGTQAMGAVWLLLGKSRFEAKLVAWSNYRKHVDTVHVPFQISAEFMPVLLKQSDAALVAASEERAPSNAAFSEIIGRCAVMKTLLDKAAVVALHNVPVLLEGETGTGKEILAAAIHNASGRKGQFITVNCGAIPESLVESELFGHQKGAFTGADRDRKGHFREAHGGTLFLDEIGELPLAAQVKLLRPLQQHRVTPVGSSESHKIDVRVIAATHRNLLDDVTRGAFREDLFYRLAVAPLPLPPLREREGDLGILADHILEGINTDNRAAGLPGKSLTPGARTALMRHSWPGNVRELAATLRRAVVWSSRSKLDETDIKNALLPGARKSAGPSQTIGPGFRLDDVLGEIQGRYIDQALELAKGSKVQAAKLLGLNSHQVLNARMEKTQRGPAR